MAVRLLAPPTPPAASAPPAPVAVAATCADQQGADGANGLAGDLSPSIIDMDIFTQLLEMDDEDDREFSKSIVWNYFDQAETTFDEMDAALSSQNLGELSTLGHFLKGSSAAVGVIKVRDSCEHMQHYGKCHGEDGMSELTKDEALKKLTITLRDVKVQYKEAAKALKAFYDEEDEQQDTQDDAPAQQEPASADEPTQQKVDPVTEEKAQSNPADQAAKPAKAQESS
ncbi:histidine phosphotransferase hpt1p [Moesziomyces antarcticus]|uniref:Histidine phosphotransferase hpt1p n=2 Tax=Pseudozyma antarctica TaxID=84753 RepID=A0A081CJQ1_PSEA2|nr:histidine phosphotransferase hpt1p [Moesziomyces antarcticus]GAK66897.1 histidine phosphotransferase hpt1p [Moesziomyces antarcticus]SPO47947.1 related to YPD1 - two-component phosphorelay intermediate [Moesziomyces antarcticus]